MRHFIKQKFLLYTENIKKYFSPVLLFLSSKHNLRIVSVLFLTLIGIQLTILASRFHTTLQQHAAAELYTITAVNPRATSASGKDISDPSLQWNFVAKTYFANTYIQVNTNVADPDNTSDRRENYRSFDYCFLIPDHGNHVQFSSINIDVNGTMSVWEYPLRFSLDQNILSWIYNHNANHTESIGCALIDNLGVNPIRLIPPSDNDRIGQNGIIVADFLVSKTEGSSPPSGCGAASNPCPPTNTPTPFYTDQKRPHATLFGHRDVCPKATGDIPTICHKQLLPSEYFTQTYQSPEHPDGKVEYTPQTLCSTSNYHTSGRTSGVIVDFTPVTGATEYSLVYWDNEQKNAPTTQILFPAMYNKQTIDWVYIPNPGNNGFAYNHQIGMKISTWGSSFSTYGTDTDIIRYQSADCTKR